MFEISIISSSNSFNNVSFLLFGKTNLENNFKRVDLPEPLSPNTAVFSFSLRSKLMSLRICLPSMETLQFLQLNQNVF